MAKYIALAFCLILIGGGFYGLTIGHPEAGGWTIFFGLIFGMWTVGRLLDEK